MPEDKVKEQKAIAKKDLKEGIVAMTVLKRADKGRYGNLQISLKNAYLLGGNNYPDTIPDLLRLLNNYKMEWTQNTMQPPTPPGSPGMGGWNSAVSFLQLSGDGVSFLRATNNSFFPAITRRLCGIKGHWQTNFPVATNYIGSGIESKRPGAVNGSGGNNAATVEEVSQRCGVILSQNNEAYINPNWFLLDSESTDHIFFNKKLLTDMEPTTDGEFLRL